MKRFAVGCTKYSHPLYPVFMSKLARYIFVWYAEDLRLLKSAKRLEMQNRGIPHPSDEDLVRSISKRELALHCWRKTRGMEETARLSYDLLKTCARQRHTLSVPLLHSQRIWDICESQKHRIQDTESVALYAQTSQQGRGITACVQMRARLHISRVIPPPSEQVHFRHLRQRHAFSSLLARRCVSLECRSCRSSS